MLVANESFRVTARPSFQDIAPVARSQRRPRLALRPIVAALALTLTFAAHANASQVHWYALRFDEGGAAAYALDSSASSSPPYVKMLRLFPRPQQGSDKPVFATQFTAEFDCAGRRTRWVEVAMLDGDGAPLGSPSKDVGEWVAFEQSGDVGVVGRIVCAGAPPPAGVKGPYASFAELWNAYQTWLRHGGRRR